MKEQVIAVPIESVEPDPSQHRRHFEPEALAQLGDSIRAVGQLTPIAVVRVNRHFRIVAGERRWRAMRQAGLTEIDAVVKDLDPLQVAGLQAAENIARSDVRPTEEGRAYQRVLDEYGQDHFPADFDRLAGSEQDEWRKRATAHCAGVTGSNFQRIGCKTRLLLLPPEVQDLVDAGSLPEAHAQVLTRLVPKGLPEEQRAERFAEARRIARAAVAQSASVSEVRAKVSVYLGERAQASLFGEQEAWSPKKAQVTRHRLARAVEHLAQAVALTFDEADQDFDVAALTGNELTVAESRIAGSVQYLQALQRRIAEARIASAKEAA